MKSRLALLALVSFLAAVTGNPVPATAQENGPKIPDNLKVPDGNEFRFKTQAEGVQIYMSEVVDGMLVWKFKAPLAHLLQDGKKAGYHYDGPSWEAMDGSKVQIDKSEKPGIAKSAKPKSAVPCLRIKVKSAGDITEKMSGVTYILRLETEGGVMPSQKPKRAGTEVGIPYKATYYFFGPGKRDK